MQQWKDPSFHLVCRKGFTDISLRACSDGPENKGFASLGCNHYDGDAGGKVLGSTGLKKLQSVHHRHVDVADDQRDRRGGSFVSAKGLKSLLAVGSLQYFEQLKTCLS